MQRNQSCMYRVHVKNKGGIMNKADLCKKNQIKKVMEDYKRGKLQSHDSYGSVVQNRKQAMAIALAESRKVCTF